MENFSTIESVAIGISTFSLFIALASLIISWRVAIRDRAGLIISCTYLRSTNTGAAFLVNSVNTGRRPITLDTIELITHDGRKFSYQDIIQHNAMYPERLPRTLEETEKVEILFPIWFTRPQIRDPRNFSRLKVIDTRGKVWSISLKKLVKDIPDDELFKNKEERNWEVK